MAVAHLIEASCDPLILQSAGPNGLEAAAVYYVWLRFPQLAAALGTNLVNSSGPSLSFAYAAKREQGQTLFHRICFAIAGMSVASVVALALWLAPFVHYWLGGRYDVREGVWVAGAMAAQVGLKNLAFLGSSVFYPLGKVKLVIVVTFCQAATKIGIGLILVQLAPILGMTIAGGAGALVAAGLYAFVLTRYEILPPSRIVQMVALITFVCAASILGSFATLGVSFWQMTTGICLTGGILVAGLAWWLLRTRVVSLVR